MRRTIYIIVFLGACISVFVAGLSAYNVTPFRWDRTNLFPVVRFSHNLEMFQTDPVNSPSRVVNEVLNTAFTEWNVDGYSNLLTGNNGATLNRTVKRDHQNTVIATLDLDILAEQFYSPNAIAAAVPWGRVQSFEIDDCDIMVFPRPYYIDPVEPGRVSLPTAFKHEVGHCLGLLHSSEAPFEGNPVLRQALMYFSISAGQDKTINVDDRSGLHALYGERVNPGDLLGNFCRGLGIDPGDPICLVVACFFAGYCEL